MSGELVGKVVTIVGDGALHGGMGTAVAYVDQPSYVINYGEGKRMIFPENQVTAAGPVLVDRDLVEDFKAVLGAGSDGEIATAAEDFMRAAGLM